MGVKTHRFEVAGWPQDDCQRLDMRERWHTLSDRCREIVNCIWQEWEVWHIEHKTHIALRTFAEEMRAFRNGERQAKPKFDAEYMPKELAKRIYDELNLRFPDVHVRVTNLVQQVVKKRMTGKDVDGRWNIWAAVLLNRQGRPNATRDQPIPFDKENSALGTSEWEGRTQYTLAVNITRIPREGKPAASYKDSVRLISKGSGRVVLQRIVAGEYKFCGSSLVWNSGRSKWFALIAYNDNAESKTIDNAKGTAVLHARRRSPWALRWNGRTHYFGGRGIYVESMRRRLLRGRWERQENYRYAGSANRGHGLKRALLGVQKLQQSWKDFVKTCNHRLTREVVDFCVTNRIKTLVYCQPTGRFAETRFLSLAGKIENRTDSTSWEWFQVRTLLAYKCEEAGVHLVIHKSGARGPAMSGNDATVQRNRSQNGNKRAGKKQSAKRAV